MTSAHGTTSKFVEDEDEIRRVCPFNQTHQVLSARMVTHILKCRENYVNNFKAQGLPPPWMECRYNSAHKLLLPEVDSHESTCPDKESSPFAEIVSMFQKPETTVSNEKPRRRRTLKDELEDEEDWGREDTGGVYMLKKFRDWS